MKAYFRDSSARMFENSFLEACSKVHPAIPAIVYLPLIAAVLVYGGLHGELSWTLTPVAAIAGWVTWCFAEYGIHRVVFHWEGNSPLTRRIHDIAHGYHHRYPDDEKRLVMPLGASVPLAVLLSSTLYFAGHPVFTLPYFCGIVAGYVFYDTVHWATHYRAPKTEWGKAMRAHHMAHHFAVHDRNFGISHRWVDRLMGTFSKRRA